MPHIIVKIHPGRGETEKRELADRIAQVLHDGMGYEVENVSVAVQEIEPSRWMTEVYEPDIVARRREIVKLPSYGPLAGKSS